MVSPPENHFLNLNIFLSVKVIVGNIKKKALRKLVKTIDVKIAAS